MPALTLNLPSFLPQSDDPKSQNEQATRALTRLATAKAKEKAERMSTTDAAARQANISIEVCKRRHPQTHKQIHSHTHPQ